MMPINPINNHLARVQTSHHFPLHVFGGSIVLLSKVNYLKKVCLISDYNQIVWVNDSCSIQHFLCKKPLVKFIN